jgi:3-dehydroquinate synthase
MARMAALTVELGDRSYPIHIGPGLLPRAEMFQPHLRGGRPFILTNETVAPLYLEPLRSALGGSGVEALVLPDGEAHKTLETAGRIYDALLAGRYARDSVLVALGGGVIGDLTGFAAATYQRGIGFIQVPTTLLAQVDSSVGGKTGVNHPLGKNMIGAFHQPLAVVADTDTLRTLPARELSAGLAEVIKYGLLGDASFFDWLELNMGRLRALEPDALTEAIRRSCANKARIVALDERESGPRALLNLGHTFGHAIETALGYGRWLHGEAVGAGLCMAADLSCRLGWLPAADRDRVIALVARAGLPTRLPAQLTPADFQRLMAHDKKVQAGRLRLVLLKAIGTAVVTADFDPARLAETVAHYCAPPPAA